MKKQELKKWHELPIGGLILDMGNSAEYQTGDWNPNHVVWLEDICTQCFLCWINCPDSSILVSGEKMTGIDYDHCKGCGICAKVCPRKCIKMEKE